MLLALLLIENVFKKIFKTGLLINTINYRPIFKMINTAVIN